MKKANKIELPIIEITGTHIVVTLLGLVFLLYVGGFKFFPYDSSSNLLTILNDDGWIIHIRNWITELVALGIILTTAVMLEKSISKTRILFGRKFEGSHTDTLGVVLFWSLIYLYYRIDMPLTALIFYSDINVNINLPI